MGVGTKKVNSHSGLSRYGWWGPLPLNLLPLFHCVYCINCIHCVHCIYCIYCVHCVPSSHFCVILTQPDIQLKCQFKGPLSLTCILLALGTNLISYTRDCWFEKSLSNTIFFVTEFNKFRTFSQICANLGKTPISACASVVGRSLI